jgi:branched-chain amino acid transport system ATP-binding protein
MSEPVLETRNLTVRFGGVTALDAVSLTCRSGEITGLIGPNGAGKTTFLDAVCGFLPRNVAGEVLLEGTDVTGLSPHRLARRGLGRTWQSVDLFDDLDIRGNLEVAAGSLTFLGALRELLTRRHPIPAVEETLEVLGMQAMAAELPSSLTQRDRKLVGVGRATAGRPALLMLDEPAAGLDRTETEDLADGLRELREEGQSILLIDHDMSLVLAVCDVMHVLDFGRVIATGTASDIRDDARVTEAYLGGAEEAAS